MINELMNFFRARQDAQTPVGREMQSDLNGQTDEQYAESLNRAHIEAYGAPIPVTPAYTPPAGEMKTRRELPGRIVAAAGQGVMNAAYELNRTVNEIGQWATDQPGVMPVLGEALQAITLDPETKTPKILPAASTNPATAVAENVITSGAQFAVPFAAMSSLFKGYQLFKVAGQDASWLTNFANEAAKGAITSLPVDFAAFDPVENNLADIAKQFGFLPEWAAFMASKSADGDVEEKLANRVRAAVANVPFGVAAQGAMSAPGLAVEGAAKAYMLAAKGMRAVRGVNWEEMERVGMQELKSATSPGRLNEGVPLDAAWSATKVLAARLMKSKGGEPLDRAAFDDVLQNVPPDQHEQVMALAEDLAAGPASGMGTVRGRTVEELKTAIPPEARVSSPRLLEPGPVKTSAGTEFKDLPLDLPGMGLRGMNDTDVANLWQQAVDESPTMAGTRAVELGASPHAAEFWNAALSLPNRARFWYEISTEAMRDMLPDFTPKELERFFGLVGATSPQANPYDNMRRALSVMGHDLAGRPANTALSFSPGSKGGLVRTELFGQDTATNKIHNFGGTFEFLAGMRDDPPLSTNDRQVAKSFNISDKELFQNQALYEPLSRFYLKMRDALNARLAPGEEPYEAWQLQALGWVEQRMRDPRGSNTGDDYMMALDTIHGKLVDAGIVDEGQPITREVLTDPRSQRVFDPTTPAFEKAPMATIEPMSERSPETARMLGMKDQWDDAARRDMAKAIRRTSNNLSTRTGTEPSIATQAFDMARGLRRLEGTGPMKAVPEITRIDYGRGTWQGNINENMRIPLRGATDRESEVFLAFYTEGLKQDLSPASVYRQVAHDSTPAAGKVRTYSVFFKEEIGDEQLKAFSDELGPNFEVSLTDTPNGAMIDIAPSFGEDGTPQGIDYETVVAAAKAKFGNKTEGAVLARDFSSTAVFHDDAPAIIQEHLREIDSKAVDRIVEIANVGRKEARAYLKSGDAASLGGIPKGRVGRAARIREEHGRLRSGITSVRQKFKEELTRQEADIKAAATALEARNAKRAAKKGPKPAKAAASEPDAAPATGTVDDTFEGKRKAKTGQRWEVFDLDAGEDDPMQRVFASKKEAREYVLAHPDKNLDMDHFGGREIAPAGPAVEPTAQEIFDSFTADDFEEMSELVKAAKEHLKGQKVSDTLMRKIEAAKEQKP
jgi:hypothetical protein